jgi:chromosome segregation ATPase
MDFEQILKRIEWLDDERRKDKLIISSLEDRLMKYEGNITPLMQEVKAVSNDLSRIQAAITKFDQIDAAISQIRVDFPRSVESIEKQRLEKDRENEKIRLADLESINLNISNVRKGLEPIPELKKDLVARAEEEKRLVRLIAEVDKKVLENKRSDDEYRRNLKLMEENIRQDSKRILDIQGEVAALRKRVEEQRGKVDLTNETLRKIEMRQNELVNAEVERKQSQTAFIERQSMIQVERDRVWREWQTRFEIIEGQALNLDAQLQALDATQRSVKHAQESFDEITQRFERRINEITEMQRLVEDRFRQEWVSFKADDQKRWSNYMLTSDEQIREIGKQFDKISDRLIKVEDSTQDFQDMLQQILQTTHKRLQTMLTVLRDQNNEFNDSFDLKS